ncbi:BufA1 family periplasmic bufferin-type metallophore [Azospirillum sp. ST 5-10]|uniref:BufA1 family periplasmic bufferin-type metallophore n=1 Tax=unclassified Azospirillum TaxID=2630922 RepID=UPI003F4A5D23
MTDKIRTALPLATVLAGALAALAAPASAQQSMEKCYGISKAGENGCAHAKGLHSCAGNSNLTYDGGDWKLVPAGACQGMDGSLTPFEGTNPKKKA